MTTALLNQATRISNTINELETHLQSFDFPERVFFAERPITINLNAKGYRDSINLFPEFANVEEFLLIYKARIAEKIKQLKAEFDALS